ncbi:alpha-glucan family phosphorylase [Kallotenue papyrolyticum]|uniref:alpha-glucan family phosphorylase n=1 Tax=Kallotenue papyrolyticum TaxID=1325125 RepID=UPI000478663B|nr:alpha-glucan family phosphorylase [Kallotenue papyrolyticum]
MNVLGRVAVFPTLPPRISRLYDLAYNLWWSWTPEAQALYAELDPELWQRVQHNPVRLLAEIDPARLEAAARDPEFLARFDAILRDFDAYMRREDTWFARTYPQYRDKTIAYFSAEFGLHESLPIYSGGLGVLAGDHIKEASDLGLPLVGIGFLYPQGYFTQRITREGVQEAFYDKLAFGTVAARPALGADGREIQVAVELPGRVVYAKVWKLQIGRVALYLMDTDVPGNAPADRELSARLYGGDHELRISQEIVLGIGGLRVVRALGLDPAVFHMNDSHPVFLVLERARELVEEQGLPFEVAREVVRASTIFTTHTPVPAGNEIFGYETIDKYFSNYWSRLGLTRDQFHDLARQQMSWGTAFSMTVLALRFSSLHNGVSRLHGAVARRMWHFLWPGITEDEVPITHITNGVHTKTWLAPDLRDLYTRYLPQDWLDRIDDPATWQPIGNIPDAELWQAHLQRKQQLLAYLRRRLRRQRLRLGEGPHALAEAETLGDPRALIIGFARRFATYKRATLIFRDRERLRRLLNDPERPVMIIFAGKAHPADEPGKALIREVYTLSRAPEFAGKIIFLENYDMEMARFLVAGVDLWLNNPIRPHEASGTSGMKAALNGVPNCSILDGWWAEGYTGTNGWAIGEEREYQDQETQNEADATDLYNRLEQEIVPAFFERDAQGLPRRWVAIMKEAIRTVAPRFSMTRQVKEYTERMYVPTIERNAAFVQSGYEKARALATWKQHIYAAWGQLALTAEGPRDTQIGVGQPIAVTADLHLGALRPEDVLVELVIGRDENWQVIETGAVRLLPQGQTPRGTYLYRNSITAEQGGSLVWGVRVIPAHPDLATKYELGLVRWA